jgi:metal-responsive CopG/Arc/MetJ family transcriptional regulator
MYDYFAEVFMQTSNDLDRVTISIPHALALQTETVRSELKISRSELVRVALERFIQEQNNSRLAIIAAEMVEEYRGNSELTALTELDGEDFV